MSFRNSLAAFAAVSVITPVISLYAEQSSAPGQPVSMVVTVEGKHNKEIPSIEAADLKVTESGDKRPISELKALRDSSLQLLILIDNSSRSTFDTEINTLKQWVNSQPVNTQIAVGYMQNGLAALTKDFTSDHAAAANSIRVTMGVGGADVSPYDSLSEAIKKWPQGAAERREVLMISSGIEGLGGGFAPENPYVNKSIADAQRAGVVVYGIYNPSAGHGEHSLWRVTYGQNLLSQLSDETGGESYITTFSSPVSFQPFLEDLSKQLQNQYRLTFVAKPAKKTELQSVKIKVMEKDADVSAADKVLVKASL